MPKNPTTKVMVVSGEPIGETRAGPAVRALAITHEVSRVAEVRLISTAMREPGISQGIHIYSRRDVKALVHWADVIVFQGFFLTEFPEVVSSGKILVSDLYAPFQLEHLLEIGGQSEPVSLDAFEQTVASVNWQLRHSDYFICASEKQREFWLGQLAAMGRINPLTISAGADFRALIDVVPFGIDEPAKPDSALKLRERIGATAGDKVLIWGGGIYDWFDPLSLIRAMRILKDKKPEIKLFFLAIKHPNHNVGVSPIILQTMNLADELGLTNTTVFFNEQWVPFEERSEYLCDADVGISIHGEHIESRFSFRTRMLDYIWAGLPIIASEGDSFAELIQRESLGAVVPFSSPEAIAEEIESFLYTPGALDDSRAKIRAIAQSFMWSNTLAPLVAFCEMPSHAADSGEEWGGILRKPRKPRPRLATAQRIVAEGGITALLKKIAQKVRG